MMLSVVMPVYNEEAAIRRVVEEHVTVLRSTPLPFEIVCVDDGSRDSTPQILLQLQHEYPEVRVVRQCNQGIYGAFTRGYQECRGTHVYSTGSDGQWPAVNLITMLSELQAGADLVVGVRTNRREIYTLSRRIVSGTFNNLPRFLFNVTLEDAGSVKLGKREIFQFDLISRSVFSEAERLIRAHDSGFRITFLPIQFMTRSGGKASGASWKNIYHSTVDLVRCWYVYRGPRRKCPGL